MKMAAQNGAAVAFSGYNSAILSLILSMAGGIECCVRDQSEVL